MLCINKEIHINNSHAISVSSNTDVDFTLLTFTHIKPISKLTHSLSLSDSHTRAHARAHTRARMHIQEQ